MQHAPPIVLYAIPIFVLLMLLEAWWLKSHQQQHSHGRYTGQDTAANLAMGIGNVVINLGWKVAVLTAYFWLFDYRLLELDVTSVGVWLAGFVLFDLAYYAFHRFGHRIRLGWAGHVNHHSSRRMNFSVALRQSWTTPLFKPFFYAPLALIGFHPLLIVTIEAVNLLYQFWLHTETVKRLGPLEWIFNTPSHHRVHHGTNDAYLDRNYGGILIIWDRLFGSFAAEHERVKYGIRGDFHSYNPLKIAFHEWAGLIHDIRHAKQWRERLHFITKPPGWKPMP